MADEGKPLFGTIQLLSMPSESAASRLDFYRKLIGCLTLFSLENSQGNQLSVVRSSVDQRQRKFVENQVRRSAELPLKLGPTNL